MAAGATVVQLQCRCAPADLVRCPEGRFRVDSTSDCPLHARSPFKFSYLSPAAGQNLFSTSLGPSSLALSTSTVFPRLYFSECNDIPRHGVSSTNQPWYLHTDGPAGGAMILHSQNDGVPRPTTLWVVHATRRATLLASVQRVTGHNPTPMYVSLVVVACLSSIVCVANQAAAVRWIELSPPVQAERP